MQNSKEQGNRRPDPHVPIINLESWYTSNHVGMQLGGHQEQMIEDTHLKVTEGQTNP